MEGEGIKASHLLCLQASVFSSSREGLCSQPELAPVTRTSHFQFVSPQRQDSCHPSDFSSSRQSTLWQSFHCCCFKNPYLEGTFILERWSPAKANIMLFFLSWGTLQFIIKYIFPLGINDLACRKAVQGEDGVHAAEKRLQLCSCPEKFHFEALAQAASHFILLCLQTTRCKHICCLFIETK